MYPTRIAQPLSPPSSPRMSGKDYAGEPFWKSHQTQRSSFPSSDIKPPSSIGVQYTSLPYDKPESQPQFAVPGGAMRHDSVAHASMTSNTKPEGYAGQDQRAGPASGDYQEVSQPFTGRAEGQAIEKSDRHGEVSLDEGAQSDQDDDDDLGDDGEEAKDDSSKPPMTAEEIRRQKRKMKRFRLTHNQTRYLMSEFARQAHPDAAHRERLAREIPGLSPRQVQVWFQNRRAKLKRLNAEDRDRVMRSRALPENFGLSMPMNTQYGSSGASSGPVIPGSEDTHGMQRPGNSIRPLTLDTQRRTGLEHNYISPTGVTSSLSSLAFTPPQSATDSHSPISTSGEMSAYGFSQRAMMDSPRRGVLPPGCSSTPTYSYPFGQAAGRNSAYDRLRRGSGDSISSPLRTSIPSYASYNSSGGPQSGQESRAGNGGDTSASQSHRETQREMPPPSAPYGLGFSYDTMASFHSQSQTPSTSAQTQTSQPTSSSYRTSPLGLGQQNSSFQPQYMDYGNQAYTSPHLQTYNSPFPAPYTSPLSSSPFGQHGTHTQAVGPPPSLQPPQYGQSAHGGAEKMKSDNGDEHSDSGAPIVSSY